MKAYRNDLDLLDVSAIAWIVKDEVAAASTQHPSVKEIRYHAPTAVGDSHFADIYMIDGAVQRIFNLTQVVFNYEADSDDIERTGGCEDQPVEDEVPLSGDGTVDGQD